MRYPTIFVLAFISTPIFADAVWSDREICRAAAKTYFFLSELPNDAPDIGAYMGFVSAKGNFYSCQIDGGVVDFAWVNKSGENMRSRSTSFTVTDGTLTVKTDMVTETFMQ